MSGAGGSDYEMFREGPEYDGDSPADRPTIVAAAVLYQGMALIASPPARHYEILHWISSMGLRASTGVQGFLTSDGLFVDRYDAARVAIEAGQVQRDVVHSSGQLFSEDLW